MTAFGHAVILLFLPLGSSAAHIYSESVVRREPQRVELTSQGSARRKAKDASAKLSPDNAPAVLNTFCDYDFPLGETGTGNCTDKEKHTPIYSEAMCREAAREANVYAHPNPDKFRIGAEYEEYRPKGCFMQPCTEASNGVCYWFNSLGADAPEHAGAANFLGVAVCSRPKYQRGTSNTNDACPADYTVIADETKCGLTASCLAESPGSSGFRIGEHNASRHLDFSGDCFLDIPGDVGFGPRKVYYNFPSPITSNGAQWGTNVKGTPICQVARATYYDDSGNEVGAEANHYEQHESAAKDTAADIVGAPAAAAAAPTPAPAAPAAPASA